MSYLQRYAVLIEYHGSAYSGWQRQSFFSNTIQEQVEIALSKVANHMIEITCAGRTDAGVHARGQVIHFESTVIRDDYAWLAGGNRYLPRDIRLQSIQKVGDDFHARYHALKRHYRYIILNSAQPSAIWRRHCYWYVPFLETELMQRAAQFLIGEHDFSAFRAAECQAKTPNRFIEKITVQREKHWVYIDVIGNAFLHHMVRNIVGTLLMVGDCRRPVAWVDEVLASKDRRKAGATAPAYGLYFYQVYYPLDMGIVLAEAGKFPL